MFKKKKQNDKEIKLEKQKEKDDQDCPMCSVPQGMIDQLLEDEKKDNK